MSSSVVLLDADDASISVTWPTIPSSSSSSPTKYCLQYRPSTSPTDNGIDSGGALLYTSLSTDLTNTNARKRNLTGAGHGFWFRVSVSKNKSRIDKDAMDYIGHTKPFKVLSMMEQSMRMQPPLAKLDNAAQSTAPKSYAVHVSWIPFGGGGDAILLGYKLQMRENEGGATWSTIAQCLSGTEVRKKNLTSDKGYQFRVRPVLRGETGGSESNLEVSVSEGGSTIAYSVASDVVGSRKDRSGSKRSSGSNGLIKLFSGVPNDSLLVKGGLKTKSVFEAFGDVDIVLFYASAHWCGPCRRFTPQLVNFYNDAKSQYSKSPTKTKNVEVVFLSADHDISGFKLYYATMPWLAVPYDCEVREKLLSFIRVTGVPRLVVLNGKTGKILESNAVGKALDLVRFSAMLK